jgi:16S rRNA (cytidine1402-2'-O)-methyltransferase
LRSADIIAAEDTRHSRPLLQQLGITTPMLAMHEHNERQRVALLLGRLQTGGIVALISDSGTPLISDPGFPLVRACHLQGVRVCPVPGPNAAICALAASGLATDRFRFEGFPARSLAARRAQFAALKNEGVTLVFYEASHRILSCLQDMAEVFGEDRRAVLARELTKRHETIIQAPLRDLCRRLNEDPNQRKGEFVVLIAGAEPEPTALSAEDERVLRILIQELSVKQAAALAARITGAKKNRLYQQALEWQRG